MSTEIRSFTTQNGTVVIFLTPEHFSVLTKTIDSANKGVQHKRASNPDRKIKSGRPTKPLFYFHPPEDNILVVDDDLKKHLNLPFL